MVTHFLRCANLVKRPHTIAVTKMGDLRPGDRVNIEVDILAKYVERLVGGRGGVTMDTLRAAGFAEE